MTTDDLLLMAYADGALNREARRMLERRLATDQTLRMRLAGLKRTTQLARLALETCDAQMPSAKSKLVLLNHNSSRLSFERKRVAVPIALVLTALAIAAGALLLWTFVNTDVRLVSPGHLSLSHQHAETAIPKGGRMS